MPRRASSRGSAALAAAVAFGLVATACAGTDDPPSASARRTAAAPSSTTTTAHHHHEDAQGGGPATDRDSHADHARDTRLPPLATRLEDASPTQRAAAEKLLARTRATLAAYRSEPAARAAGYVPNDTTKRVIHYHSPANRRDRRELDPTHPEGLVYFRLADGRLHLLGAVFTAWPGEDAPAPGGHIFSWHTHNPSCGSFLVPAGECLDTFRMLHIWTAPRVEDPWIQPIQQAFGWDDHPTKQTGAPPASA